MAPGTALNLAYDIDHIDVDLVAHIGIVLCLAENQAGHVDILKIFQE